jgi:glutamate synthase domain-containing protein 2/glutamate synthase domain-containing protein 1/glutamate synthase domain-containing protein 3
MGKNAPSITFSCGAIGVGATELGGKLSIRPLKGYNDPCSIRAGGITVTHLDVFGYPRQEKSACGVGFVASRQGEYSHQIVEEALYALACVEHRGACAADQRTSDGAGLMTDIPFDLLGYERGTVAVATLFVSPDPEPQRRLLQLFEETFGFWDMPILNYREVPVDLSILGEQARRSLPTILHAIIQRPVHANNDVAFNHMLYRALRKTFTRQRRLYPEPPFFVASLSVNTIVYKALTRSEYLGKFYLDLMRSDYKSRFAMFHRRFSTNTVTSWDKAQPFRLLGHNGEINTIQGNRSWAYSREKTLGLPRNELLTHEGISDSGSLNEMVEALMYRSSLPYIEDAVALIIPPSDLRNSFYKFWSRAMEPWDGPAMVTFSDGEIVGARLDRNGFRPCRWMMSESRFYLASETGIFNVPDAQILARGALRAGRGVQVELASGQVDFTDPSEARRNANVIFDPRLYPLDYLPPSAEADVPAECPALFQYTREAREKILAPMVALGKEPIGSMGDTARLAVLSDQVRSFFDFFYQNFAQVTNPPLDYLREKMVTQLSVYLGVRPNIISQKELIPPPVGWELKSPLLSLGQLDYLQQQGQTQTGTGLKAVVVNMTFRRLHGPVDFNHRLEELAQEVVAAVKNHASIVILSDRDADWENLPLPVLLVLRRAIIALDKAGLRLQASLVVDSGQIYETHHVACTIGFGASALCPWLALQMARQGALGAEGLTPEAREKNLLAAYEGGLLKVMSKMGISVVQSYQSAKLFTIIGLDRELSHLYFRGVPSLVSGLNLSDIATRLLQEADAAQAASASGQPLHNYLLREHNRHEKGERHAMTALRSRQIHRALAAEGAIEQKALWQSYLADLKSEAPYHLRHLLGFQPPAMPLPLEQVQSPAEILTCFGSGAMSFGAISAESQRDIIQAMAEIGGRSNSGEGGENPYYESDGISASIKQVASGRFGVTARYLMAANEFQIKVAQGAKPGEGGQLMAPKVDAAIAKARHSLTHVDLISPPPLHDIYSIEDLKELIYELKQLKPTALVSVKLVAGAHIGTIAVGVAKAGADIIQISGNDGGTGAASLSSMKHAGLPFEFGLVEVHQALLDNQLREQIILRVDGGLQTGQEVLMAALLGADQFDFGKLLLIAEGCVMARVCEKNTCPTGIASHDPKFKAKYRGGSNAIVQLLRLVAEDLRLGLAELGLPSLSAARGRTDLLQIQPPYRALVNALKLDLGFLLGAPRLALQPSQWPAGQQTVANPLNLKLLYDCMPALDNNQSLSLSYPINSRDRAILATLSGELARRQHFNHLAELSAKSLPYPVFDQTLQIILTGSAGQGFGAFLTAGLQVYLYGEANDSVAKSMSGGRMVIMPTPHTRLQPQQDVIIGNGALYGATGGTLYVRGMAGDRFAVRNSGAISVVEGTGFHACEYMTHGCVVILGPAGPNIGSGMTGGQIFLLDAAPEHINSEYVSARPCSEADYAQLRALLEDYFRETGSQTVEPLLHAWEQERRRFVRYLPVNLLEAAPLLLPVRS